MARLGALGPASSEMRWFAKKQFEKKASKVRRHAHKFQTGAPAPSLGQHSVPTQPMDAAALLAAQGGAASDATSAASTASQQKQRGAGVDDDDANQPLLLPRKKQKRMKNLAAQGGATTDATAITASLKKQLPSSKLARKTWMKKKLEAAATAAKRSSTSNGDDKANSPLSRSVTMHGRGNVAGYTQNQTTDRKRILDEAALLATQGEAIADATSAASTASLKKQRGAGGGDDDDDADQPLLSPSKSKSTTTTQRQPLALRAHRSRLNKTMDWNRTLDSGQPLLIPSGSTSKSEATTTTAKRSTTSKLAAKKQKRMKNLAAQGGATTDATAITASLKKQRGGGDDDADQPLLLKPKPKRQISSGIRTNDDNTNAKPAVRAMEPASRHACGSFRGFQPRVPLKPAAAASATSANTGSEAPKEEATPEQIDLVRQVQSGAIISILWRWGRSLDNNPGHKDGACLYYSGEDEYFSAKIMQWRKVRGRRLFRLIYDDGCVENDINLLEQTFRILHLQDPDEVKEEGGLFLV